MDNVEIAHVLNEYAALLEIQGESPFRIRAYHQAARTLEGLSQPVVQLLQKQADLTMLPGIGDRIAAHIQEIVNTGTLAAFEQTQKEVPRSLTELLKLETLGPQKVKQLYEQLGVTSVAKLQKALATGNVEKLAGFGPKTVARLQRAITEITGRAGRLKLADADRLAEPLLAYLRDAPGVGQVEVAGSLRRRQETIGDIDILVTCNRPQPMMDHFLSYPDIQRAERGGG